MKFKFAAVTLVAALAVPLAIVSQGAASGQGNSKSARDGGPSIKLYAKFARPVLPLVLPDEFKSRVKYQRKSNNKGTEEGIEAKVLFAMPAETALDPLVDTKGFLVRILTAGVEKGSCVLVAKAIELEYLAGVLSEFDFRFAAKVQEKTPIAGPPSTIRNRVGDCWVTTAVAPAVPGRGVPDVALGDTVEVSAITLPVLPLTAAPAPGTLLLSGVFGTGHDHGDDEDDDDDND
jgi:hypothetical protein